MRKKLKLEIPIDPECELCGDTMRYFKEIMKPNKEYYGAKNLKTGKFIRGIIIRPDYNSEGIITHYHLDIEDELNTTKKIVCPTCEGTKHVRPQDMRKGEEEHYQYSKHFSCPECKGEGYVWM